MKIVPSAPASFEYIVVRPSQIQSKAPLIAFPHGGPHSAFSVDYIPNVVGFVALGYFVVMVNYRGSTGFGKVRMIQFHIISHMKININSIAQKSIFSLPGNVGVNDVHDCNDAVSATLAEYSEQIDPESV